MRSTLVLFLLGCQAPEGPRAHYEFAVSGAVTMRAGGCPEAGPVGTADDPWFSVSLGGLDGGVAVVLTRAGSAPLVRGVYVVGESAFYDGTGFSGLIVTGAPSHPTGVFRVRHGTIHITAVGADQLAGRFALQAHGYLTDTPHDVGRSVEAAGTFSTSTRDKEGCQP
jgi:hypothetical protein